MRRILIGLLVLGSIGSLAAPAFAQCAMCVTALQNSAEGRGLAESFGHGILFLLFIPYMLFGIVSYHVYRAYRQRSRVQAQNQPFSKVNQAFAQRHEDATRLL